MERSSIGTVELRDNFISQRDKHLKEETGEDDRYVRRGRLHAELSELRKLVCRKMHRPDCKEQEIFDLAKSATSLLSELLKIDWEETRELCNSLSTLVDIERKENVKQKPKIKTLAGVEEVFLPHILCRYIYVCRYVCVDMCV